MNYAIKLLSPKLTWGGILIFSLFSIPQHASAISCMNGTHLVDVSIKKPKGELGSSMVRWLELSGNIPRAKGEIERLKRKAAFESVGEAVTDLLTQQNFDLSGREAQSLVAQIGADAQARAKQLGIEEMAASIRQDKVALAALEEKIEQQRPGLLRQIHSLSRHWRFGQITKYLWEGEDWFWGTTQERRCR